MSPNAPEFVSFHAFPPRTRDRVHPNANLDADRYLEMLDLLFRSARMFHPGAACTLLTDSVAQVHGIRGELQPVEVPVEHGRLMLSRSVAQLAYVDRSDFRRPIVLTDSDILVRASLRPVFDADFDVALTWRENERMPINGGFMILDNRRPSRAKAFLARTVEIYRERYADDAQAAWFGDQLALRDHVGLDAARMRDVRTVDIDGCRVLLLPCDQFNFSPRNRFGAIASGLGDKSILHFKGERKRLMRPFWDAFLAPREHPGLRAAWRGFRARRAVASAMRAEARQTTSDIDRNEP